MVNNPADWNRFTETVPMVQSAVAPPASTVIADSGALAEGIYHVSVSGSYGGTADVIDNMALFRGDKKVCNLPVIPLANSTPVQLDLWGLRVLKGTHLTVQNLTAGGAGSVFRAILIATPVQTQDFI